MAATQVNHPWRATVRTTVQAVVSFAVVLPLIVAAAGVPMEGGVAVAIAVAAGLTRVMAVPEVEGFIRVYLPWLAAQPKTVAGPDEDWALEAPEATSDDGSFYR